MSSWAETTGRLVSRVVRMRPRDSEHAPDYSTTFVEGYRPPVPPPAPRRPAP